MDEYEQAWNDYHDDFIKRKNEIITKLVSIRDSAISNEVMKAWLNQAIEFINDQKG